MADITNVSTPVVRPSAQRSGVGGARPPVVSGVAPAAAKGYGDAGDVSRRANVLNNVETPQNQASLNRLDRALSSGQPLRGDVPRGFYLDLKV